MNLLELLLPVALGLGSHRLFQVFKRSSRLVDRLPPTLKQAAVLGIAAGVTFATAYVPGLDRIASLADPELAAGIAAATAYAAHRPSSFSAPKPGQGRGL